MAFVYAAVGAAAASLVVLIVVWRNPVVRVVPVAQKLAWDDRTLAAASREIAVRECAARRWTACLDQLVLVKTLDPSAFGPDEQAAQAAAVAGLRGDALRACEKQEWLECRDGLDEAGKYDPRSDDDPLVLHARTEVRLHVRERQQRPLQPLPDAKGPFMPKPPR
jgi:hypothetical protein